MAAEGAAAGGCVGTWALQEEADAVPTARPGLANVSRGPAPGCLCDLWQGPLLSLDFSFPT